MRYPILAIVILLSTCSSWAGEPPADRERLDFFETKIRPVLVQHCYECHAADSKMLRGGLLVDSRQGLLEGGESGPAVVPGNLEESLLISALRHDDFEMPPQGKLPRTIIADFEKWITAGAVDPRHATIEVTKPNLIDVEAGRKHWAYQPLRAPAIPKVKNISWPNNDIDRFVLAGLESTRLQPGPDAEKIVLVRRLYFDLTGLPPLPDQITQFINDKSPLAYESLVDQLLALSLIHI